MVEIKTPSREQTETVIGQAVINNIE
ncbi:hypothetical protein LCGC14_1646380, partial [marine sediment metagenome]